MPFCASPTPRRPGAVSRREAPPSFPRRRESIGLLLLPLLILAACALVSLLVAAPGASAHSRHEGSVEIHRGAVGPYDLLVEAVPGVGFFEITIVFEPDAAGDSLPYAPSAVVSARRDGERLGPATAIRTGPNEYVAVFAPESAGEWEVGIAIDSELGSASLVVPVTIEAQRASIPWTAVIAGLGLLIPMLWLIFAPRKARLRASASGRSPQ